MIPPSGVSLRRHAECAVMFMAKWPEPGRSKTRLCPPLTPDEAAGLARCFLLDMLAGAGASGFACGIAYAPSSAADRKSVV